MSGRSHGGAPTRDRGIELIRKCGPTLQPEDAVAIAARLDVTVRTIRDWAKSIGVEVVVDCGMSDVKRRLHKIAPSGYVRSRWGRW